jgi:hypothetical protein
MVYAEPWQKAEQKNQVSDRGFLVHFELVTHIGTQAIPELYLISGGLTTWK